MTRRLAPVLLVLVLAAAGCAATADHADAPAVSGAYVTGSGGWHS